MALDDKKATPKNTDSSIMHSFKDGIDSKAKKKLIIFLAVVALLGVGTGFTLGKQSAQSGKNVPLTQSKDGSAAKGKIFGSDDTKTFKDTAEGIVKKGGIEGEGQYHLERPGGESQNVYMTSSTVDLSEFINKKIKVWGQTQTAQKAGWLMDVGRVEVL